MAGRTILLKYVIPNKIDKWNDDLQNHPPSVDENTWHININCNAWSPLVYVRLYPRPHFHQPDEQQ